MSNTRLSHLQEMLREDPKDSFLRYAIAVEYSAAGNNAEAISRIESLLNDQPEYLGAYYKLGQLYEQESQNEKAIDVYKRGAVVAKSQGNQKTLGEINTALLQLED